MLILWKEEYVSTIPWRLDSSNRLRSVFKTSGETDGRQSDPMLGYLHYVVPAEWQHKSLLTKFRLRRSSSSDTQHLFALGLRVSSGSCL